MTPLSMFGLDFDPPKGFRFHVSDYTIPATVTVTVIVTVCDSPPLDPVTVTVYVPGAVSREVENVKIAEPVLWGARKTSEELIDTVGDDRESPAVMLAGLTVAFKLTTPENPLMLARVRLELPDEPTGTLMEVRVIRLKSTT
jgi:hypothetical protein